MADFDIYDDLELLHAQEQQKAAEDLQWKQKYEVALGTIEKLQIEKKELNKKIKQLEVNFASLLDTARTEIKRKDNLITELRREKDDICFRRNERPIRRDPVKNIVGNPAKRDEHFNAFGLGTPSTVAKVVDRSVEEQVVASGSKQRNETEKPSNRDRSRDPQFDRDRSRYRNKDESGRRDERDFNRKYDRDLSQTGSSDSNRDIPNKAKNTYSRHMSNRKDKPSNAIVHKSSPSKLEKYTKETPEASKELKKNVSHPTKTENFISNDSQKKKANPIDHKENEKNPTLEKEILKDVKEFKKLKLAEEKCPKPVEDPIKVATEKSNLFIDALFDDMLMNDEGETNDLKESTTNECISVKSALEKKTDGIVSKTDENCNVELQLGTPLKQSVNKLFDDLFGPSPGVTASTVRSSSTSPIDDFLRDAVEVKEKPNQFISIPTSKTSTAADVTVDKSSSKNNEGGQTTNIAKPSAHGQTAKSFKFFELDSSFYSSEEEDVSRKQKSNNSQSDIDSPPFENCTVLTTSVENDVNPVKSMESNGVGQRVKSDNNKKRISETIQKQTSISRKCDKRKDSVTLTQKREPGDVERDQSRKLPHFEKQREFQHSHQTSEKNGKKDESTRKDSYSHNHPSKHRNGSSSSRSNYSRTSDGIRANSERHHCHLSIESKQEHRSSGASKNSSSCNSSKSSRRYARDSRYRSSNESKNKRTDKRIEKYRNGVDSIKAKEVIPLDTSSSKSQSNTTSFIKDPPLQEDNSSDLKLYNDQLISLDCDDISDDDNRILIRKESSVGSEQNPGDVGLDEISDDEFGTGVSVTNAEHVHRANEDCNKKSDKEKAAADKDQAQDDQEHENRSRSNVKAKENRNVENKMGQEQNTWENKEHKSNGNLVESCKVIKEKENKVETTNCEAECISASTIDESIGPTNEDEFIGTLNDARESSKFGKEKEIVENTEIEADSVEPRSENFKPNDENEWISDFIDQSELVRTPIGKDNNVLVKVVVEERFDVSSSAPESQTDTNDKLNAKAEMPTDEVPPISDVKDLSKRKINDKIDSVSIITEVNEAIKSIIDEGMESSFKNEDSSPVLEPIKSPKLTEASTTAVESKTDEKVESSKSSVPTNDEQLLDPLRPSPSKALVPYVERNRTKSASWSIGSEMVSTGRRKKLKTPRKCTDDGTNPVTIITILSSRYAKSEDGRSTISCKSPQTSSPHLRRTQSSSNLASVHEKSEIQSDIPTQETLKPASKEVPEGISCITSPKEDQQIAKPTLNNSALDSEKNTASKMLTTSSNHFITSEQTNSSPESVATSISRKRKRNKISPVEQDQQGAKPTKNTSKLDCKKDKTEMVQATAAKNIKKVLATSSENFAIHSQDDSPEEGFITSEKTSSKGESVGTSISKKQKRDKIIANSTSHSDEGAVVTVGASIIPHKERILENSTTACESSTAVTEKSWIKDKQGKKKLPYKGSAPSTTSPRTTNGMHITTTCSKEMHTNKLENHDFTPIVGGKPNDSEVSAPEESTVSSGKSLQNSPANSPDIKEIRNKNVAISFPAAKSPTKKNSNKNTDPFPIHTEPGASIVGTTIVPSDWIQTSDIDIDSIATSAENLLKSPPYAVQQHELPVATSPSIEVTEFLVLHSVKSAPTTDNKRKYKKRITENFIDSDPNASDDDKPKILQNSSRFDESSDEALVTVSDSKNIHHKKRLIQQSIVTESSAIDESRSPDVQNKKKQMKIVQNRTSTEKEQNTDVMAEMVTPSRQKKKRNRSFPDVKETPNEKILSNVEDTAFSTPVTSRNKKKRNTSSVHNSPDSDMEKATAYNNTGQQEESLRISPDFDASVSTTTNLTKVPAATHSNKKYKKRILQSFTGSNSIEDEASNVQNLQHSTKSNAIDCIAVDNKNKKQNSSDSNAEQFVTAVAQVQDPAPCQNKLAANGIDSVGKHSAVEGNDSIFSSKRSLIISITKLKSPRKPNCTPVIEEIIHQGNTLKGSSSSIDPSVCDQNSLSTCFLETKQGGILKDVETPESNMSSVYIKRKMKPSKQGSQKKKKLKLDPSIPPNDCDKPSSLFTPEKISKGKTTPSHDRTPAATPTHHEIFNADVFPENQQAMLPVDYNDNDDNVQYQEIDNQMRSMFQSPPYSHTNGGSSFELVNNSLLDDDNLKDNSTVEEKLNQSDKSLCDTSSSSRKVSVGSNDYVIETVGALTANVFITRKKTKKRSKIQ